MLNKEIENHLKLNPTEEGRLNLLTYLYERSEERRVGKECRL